ncbi:tyrosine-type recombinase/integrase [Micromonospora sp. CPCC 206061]|uniref:tyrosine-type recombinase/integrase n=1 Tax=Micromonospora sp. CPCC 206061 TaxID=3122410 RepID=UPI002FF0A194
MSTLAEQAGEYLRLRRALGHDLAEVARLLPRFVAHLDDTGITTITVDAALAWVLQPNAGPGSNLRARRMTVARGFARHMAGIDPCTQVPPLGLVTYRQRWRAPFIYSAADVRALMAEAARSIPTPLRAATYQTLIGLLAASGMRVGEALRLERFDIDWAEATITVRTSKFGKSRQLPLKSSTVDALASYAEQRNRFQPRPRTEAFFVSSAGTAVIYPHFGLF